MESNDYIPRHLTTPKAGHLLSAAVIQSLSRHSYCILFDKTITILHCFDLEKDNIASTT